jgi:hypothetical protein
MGAKLWEKGSGFTGLKDYQDKRMSIPIASRNPVNHFEQPQGHGKGKVVFRKVRISEKGDTGF